MTLVISLGGSIVAPPNGPDGLFLLKFKALLKSWLAQGDRKAILVVGGGTAARLWQSAYRDYLKLAGTESGSSFDESLDRIGIAATRLNAQLVKEVFREDCLDPVVTDPTSDFAMSGTILVAAGWKPGFSTDYDAVLLAERFSAKKVINLSNIAQIYTADPKVDPSAKPLSSIAYDSLSQIVGTEWNPGANVPFDPIAVKKAKALGLSVIFASGKDLDNFSNILDDKPFVGTVIS